MKKEDETIVNGCLTALASIAMAVLVGATINAVTVSILWRWFVVSSLHLPQLTVAHAYGICLLASVLARFAMGEPRIKPVTSLKDAAVQLLGPSCVALACGWTVHTLFVR